MGTERTKAAPAEAKKREVKFGRPMAPRAPTPGGPRAHPRLREDEASYRTIAAALDDAGISTALGAKGWSAEMRQVVLTASDSDDH